MSDSFPSLFAGELINGLSLKDLVFVQNIAERKSLSGAAIQFGLTQPAASRWLRGIEGLFRAHLFTRDRMVGMTPTPLGDLVLRRARALLADVSSLSSEIEAHRAGRGGHLQLGVIPYISTRLLEKLVSTLLADYAMTVSVVEAPTEPLLESLQMQRLHAIIGRYSTHRLAPDLNQEVLFTQKACLLVNGDIPSTPHLKLADFAAFRWILPPRDSPTWHAIVTAFNSVKIAVPQPVLETASTSLVHAMVGAHADLVAVLPLDVGLDLEKLGRVRVLPFPATFKLPPVTMIAHSRQWEFSHLVALRTTLRHLIASGQVL